MKLLPPDIRATVIHQPNLKSRLWRMPPEFKCNLEIVRQFKLKCPMDIGGPGGSKFIGQLKRIALHAFGHPDRGLAVFRGDGLPFPDMLKTVK